MLSDEPGPTQYLKAILCGEIGLSEKSAALLIEAHGELDVQRHTMYCLWMMDQGKVHVPPAWLTASLKGDWSAPHGMPSDWLPTVLHFRVDENTFAEFAREIREDKGNLKNQAPGAENAWGYFCSSIPILVLLFIKRNFLLTVVASA